MEKAFAKFSSINAWHEFKSYLLSVNRFILDEQQQEFIDNVILTAQNRSVQLKQGELWYRARRYVEDHGKYPIREGNKKIGGIFPASKREIISPPMNLASDGRANPRQFPMLYLAKDKETAMAETRPFMYESLTVATFTIDVDLKIVDLSNSQFREIDEAFYPKERKGEITQLDIEKYIWKEIGQDYSTPTDPSDSSGKYVSTQYLAGAFMRSGFDGIIYSSSLREDGVNLVLFDPGAANPREGQVFHTRSIEYSFTPTGLPKSYR